MRRRLGRAPAPALLAAALALVVPAGALAYVRSTTSNGNPAVGAPLFWKDAQLKYFVNASGFKGQPGCASPAAAAALARASVAAWEGATRAGEPQACTRFRFVDGGDTTRTAVGSDGANLIVFRAGLCSAVNDPICQAPADGDLGPCVEAYNCWSHDSNTGGGGIVALTTISFKPGSGEILDTDMELNGWNALQPPQATGFYYTCVDPPAGACARTGYGQASCIGYDLGSTVTHEAGHMLGLDHVCVDSYPAPYNACPNYGTALNPINPVMAPTTAIGETTKRTLKADDVEGVCQIYPVDGGGSCGSGAGGVLTLGALAVGYGLWIRLRRRSA